ncbi:MAG: hypothetical protein P8077_04685 [Gammaproteobacteria bacterium]
MKTALSVIIAALLLTSCGGSSPASRQQASPGASLTSALQTADLTSSTALERAPVNGQLPASLRPPTL